MESPDARMGGGFAPSHAASLARPGRAPFRAGDGRLRSGVLSLSRQLAGGRCSQSAYSGTFVFDNDFAALDPRTPSEECDLEGRGLIRAQGEPGICRVVCFSPRHDLTLSSMPVKDIRAVVDVWTEQHAAWRPRSTGYVQIFENRGVMMGASNPHPHCQIWATAMFPMSRRRRRAVWRNTASGTGQCLLCDYLALEQQARERIVFESQHFVALVPFWAVWPFEVMLLATRHCTDLGPGRRRTQRAWIGPEGGHVNLQWRLRCRIPLLHGISRRPRRWPAASGVAPARALLSAAAAFRNRAEISGWIRDAGQPSTRLYPRKRGRPFARTRPG